MGLNTSPTARGTAVVVGPVLSTIYLKSWRQADTACSVQGETTPTSTLITTTRQALPDVCLQLAGVT